MPHIIWIEINRFIFENFHESFIQILGFESGITGRGHPIQVRGRTKPNRVLSLSSGLNKGFMPLSRKVDEKLTVHHDEIRRLKRLKLNDNRKWTVQMVNTGISTVQFFNIKYSFKRYRNVSRRF